MLWWTCQPDGPFALLENFKSRISAEVLPVHYQKRVMNELQSRTQHPDESFIGYITIKADASGDPGCLEGGKGGSSDRAVLHTQPHVPNVGRAAPTSTEY